MDAKYYSDVAAMVAKATKDLSDWESLRVNDPPMSALKDIAVALLDRGNIHPEIIAILDAGSRNKFQSSVNKIGSVFSYNRAPDGNVGIQNALHEVQRVAKLMENQKKQEEAKAPALQDVASSAGFVNDKRISDLRELQSPPFDPRRLIRLLEELNAVYAAKCYMATIMIVRAVLDHVPPVFGCRNFGEVASNYGGGKSFKESMEQLEKSSRKIADGQLHSHIRKQEDIPTSHGVEFRAPIDHLIGEVTRLLRNP